jgi:hypothetical protein
VAWEREPAGNCDQKFGTDPCQVEVLDLPLALEAVYPRSRRQDSTAQSPSPASCWVRNRMCCGHTDINSLL